MILFEHPLSPYAQKIKIALREKGLAFELRTPDGLGSGNGYGSDFTRASPRAEVPALIDDDACIFDSTIILEYLEDKWPQPPLLPADPYARARARMIEDAMDTHYEAINWGLIEIRLMGRAPGALGAQITARATEQAAAWRLEKQLNYRVEVDGGINNETVAECAAAGADTFVAGTALFSRRNMKAAVTKMQKIANANDPALADLKV